jgi:hypothetical protein
MRENMVLFELSTNNVLFFNIKISTSLQTQDTFSTGTVFSLFVSISDVNFHFKLKVTASIRQENGRQDAGESYHCDIRQEFQEAERLKLILWSCKQPVRMQVRQ